MKAAIVIATVIAAAASAASANAAIRYAVHTYRHEGNAQKHCPDDEIVYGQTKTRSYVTQSNPSFGHLERGRYFCKKEADKERWRAAAPD